MPSPAILVAIVILYIALQVLVGWYADNRRTTPTRLSPYLYGLSLATLCSAWTYFGAVGDATGGKWLFVANALGPILAVTVGFPVWRRIARLAKQENVGSLADFLAARYGKSRTLGILCACVATAGALPYIALQLDILIRAWSFASGQSQSHAAGFLLTAMLAAIAIVFGARRPSLTQQNRGFISMLALEALVKISGLLAVAALVATLLWRMPSGPALAAAIPPLGGALSPSFFILTMLCTLTAFTLPRQFHLGFVALNDPKDMRTARWLVPSYFILWACATLVIAVGARAGLGETGVEPALQVLAIPLRQLDSLVTVLALLGGLSAGAAMVVVETTAISAMISNELIVPLLVPLLARRVANRSANFDSGRTVLVVRRSTIVLVAALSWLYYIGIEREVSPTQLGQTALAAFAQFAPALFGAVYWRRGHADGAVAGIGAGALIWAIAIAAPAMTGGAHDRGVSALPVSNQELAILFSLLVNTGLYIMVSLYAPARPVDRIQASVFVGQEPQPNPAEAPIIQASLKDIGILLSRFMGKEDAERALFEMWSSTNGGAFHDDAAISATQARLVEKILAGVIGAPSARNVISIALARIGTSANRKSAVEVDQILDEAAHAVHFSRDLLHNTLEALSQGVGMLDADGRLVAWNVNFMRFLQLPTNEVYVSKPLAEFVRDLEAQDDGEVRERLLVVVDAVAARGDLLVEWYDDTGHILQVTGKPLAQGDYLVTLTDVTDVKAAELVLAEDNEKLEQRVQVRTQELSAANAALAEANLVAERVSNAQKRFVAAASHDLVQPLHAARLFIANVLPALEPDKALVAMLERADQAVDAAHGLMRALLDLSRLEIGALQPSLQAVEISELLQSLGAEFVPQARSRRLKLDILPTRYWVRTDRDLLRSMLQNLLLNALRYTQEGRVVVAVRRAGDAVRIEVRDTGVGISSEKVEAAFDEYSRLDEGLFMADGAGLGLSIVSRIGQVLDHPIAVQSRPGAGSVFSITVPKAQPIVRVRAPLPVFPDLNKLRVLCIDDEKDILVGTKALIERWGGVVNAMSSGEELVSAEQCWDVVIADHHLPGQNGLSVLRGLAGRAGERILLTATPEEGWDTELRKESIRLLRKPISPLELHSVLSGAATRLAAVP